MALLDTLTSGLGEKQLNEQGISEDFMSQKQMVSWNEYVRHLTCKVQLENRPHHSLTPKGGTGGS